VARAKSQENGRVDRLEEALTTMLHGQALLQQQLASLAARQADTDSRIADLERSNGERFQRIEAILLDHSRILEDHSRILAALPDAVRERMGFKP
jgi:hypothetical protein